MRYLFFQKAWSSGELRIAFGVLFILLLALVFFCIKILDPLGNVVRWDILSELSDLSTAVDVIRLDNWQYGVSVPSYLVTEQFVASTMEVDFGAVRIFLGLGLIGLSLLLAGLTTLPRFWYLGSMVGFILLLAASQTETLGLFGEGSRAFFILALVLYTGLSYFFHAFRPGASIALRLFSFLGVSAGLTLLVAFTATVPHPDLTAATYSLPMWLFLSALFLLISATEIMAGLVWLSTTSRIGMGRTSLTNFLVISILYLIYLLMLFLRNTRQIEWDVPMVSPAVLAIVAGLLGIWGFRARSEATNGILYYREGSFWWYVGLFIITAAFGGYVAATANDPLLEVLEDVVVNGQLAMGLLFLFYILANFLPLFEKGLAVHKILYKPLKFGLTQTRLLGFAGFVVLISTQTLLPVYQAVAGYFNGLGDLYTTTREYALAEQYYKLALQQEFQNHKSNYALASLSLRQGDRTAAAFYFRQATLKNPSPQAYVGLSNVLVQENLFFDAVFSLREGITTFPKSGELLNNLGMLYARTNLADSAYHYLDRAERTAQRSEVPATNLLAIWARNTDAPLLDSLVQQLDEKEYPSWQANWLAVQNLRQNFAERRFRKEAIPADSLLNVSGLAYIYNYALNQARTDSMPIRLASQLADKNPYLVDDLLLASLYPEFYSGDKLRALAIMTAWVEEGGEKEPLFRKILGHWYLQLGLYDQAIEQLALVKGPEGLLGQAVAQALAGQGAVATILLERLQKEGPNPSVQALQESLADGVRPVGQADSLLTAARANPSAGSYERALRANPLNAGVVVSTSEYYRQQKQPTKAYQIVVDALRFNDRAAGLWAQYALLSLDMGLLEQADEGAARVEANTSAADYQAFRERYQPRKALIEKQREDFR
ncbi:hypothetical protein [Telluribacter sp.]|jgi:Flp pilus assembly protein TadD|uniref:tetratricopeptide repeat protein n=1 Tax=Telluribacter sp. TaxID=1978767 RepID=UPI002E0E6100|nr:hypothetical protein [Telluribacter sp.]